MPKFSTKSDFDKIMSKSHVAKTIYTYSKNNQLLLECSTTKTSIVFRERINNKYRKKCIGRANGKTYDEIMKIFHDCLANGISKNLNETRLSLGDYFYKEYVPAVSSYKRSIDQDKSFMKLHILPVLGTTEISKISKSDIQNLIKALAAKGQKPMTQRRLIYCLSAVLTHAVSSDVIPTNPIMQVKKPTTKLSVGKVPDFDTFKKMLAASRSYEDGIIGCLITAAIRTGARLSEIKNAKWDEIDFTTMTWFFPITKSNTSRTISIPPDLANDLKNLQSQRPETIYVFESKKGKKPIAKPHDRWKKFLETNGFPDMRFHDLRHSFATYTLEQANFTLIELRDHLGHSSVATTQIYTKASHKSTASKLEAFMM